MKISKDKTCITCTEKKKKITFHTQNHIPQKSRKSADSAYKHNIKLTYYLAWD